MSAKRRETEAMPGLEQRESAIPVVSDRLAEAAETERARQASEREALKKLKDDYTTKLSKRSALEEKVKTYLEKAPADDPMAKQIIQAQTEEAELLRELSELRQNMIREQEYMQEYRDQALVQAAGIRISQKEVYVAERSFDKAGYKDLKAHKKELTKLRKTTEAALHVLTRLRLLVPDYPPAAESPPSAPSVDESIEPTLESAKFIHGLMEFDEETLTSLEAEFQALRF